MAKVTPTYTPGYKGHVKIDNVSVPMTGWKADDSVEALDCMTDADNGFTKKEAGARTVKVTFTIPLEAASTSAPVEAGDILPMTFLINTTKKYDGSFTVLNANVNADFKGVVSLDVTAENYGDVTPVVTP